MHRRTFIQSAAALLAGAPSLQAAAQALEQVRILVGYAPGGANDMVSRSVASKLAGSPFTRTTPIVENRTGAAGQVACVALKSARADGSTLLCTSFSTTAIFPHVYRTLGYDAFSDFAPVSTAATASLALGVGPAVPQSVQTVRDFVQWVKQHQTHQTYATPGAGTIAHFLGALLGLQMGVNYVQVAYRGSSPGVADLVAGQVPAMFTVLGDFLPHHRSGKLRLLATSAPQRTSFTPEVASFAEQGFSELTAEETLGFFAPVATPAPILDAANASIRSALADPAVTNALAQIGLSARGSTRQEMQARHRAEYDRWGPVVRRIGFTAES